MLQGTIEGYEHEYILDEGHTFETGRPVRVCGNSAAMLGGHSVSWLSPHFKVAFSQKAIKHYQFECYRTARLAKRDGRD